jgi:hypothetical protein
MATPRYGKGSWIYKILIVVLTVALIGSIYWPKKLWEDEARNAQECRNRMNNIYNAMLFFQHFNTEFTDSLDLLIKFIKQDSSYHAYVDSVVSRPLERYIYEFDSLRQKQLAFESIFVSIDPLDSTAVDTFTREVDGLVLANRLMRDRLDVLREEMKRHPYTPLQFFDRALEIIERKDFYLQYEIIRNMVAQNRTQDALDASKTILANYTVIEEKLNKTFTEIPNMYALADSLYYCPTTRYNYNLEIVLVDTAHAVKEVIVSCPIDSAYIEKIESDFLLSTIGALTIENHGRIKGGEKSWEEKR